MLLRFETTSVKDWRLYHRDLVPNITAGGRTNHTATPKKKPDKRLPISFPPAARVLCSERGVLAAFEGWTGWTAWRGSDRVSSINNAMIYGNEKGGVQYRKIGQWVRCEKIVVRPGMYSDRQAQIRG